MSEAPTSANIEIDNPKVLMAITGPHAQLLGEVAKASGAAVNLRGNTILLSGAPNDVQVAGRFLEGAVALVSNGVEIGKHDVARSLRNLREDPDVSLASLLDETIIVSNRHRPIVPKGATQRAYITQIREHDLTFGIGPAGTGKTYLAMAMAARALVQREVKRIILTRPAVEAGERLGFLPGDLVEKVNPYLRPLYDALHEMLDFEKVEQLRSRGQIEVAPLAFMRGRTLNEAFVILDEAQNATSEQMRMFLTRLGFGSKAVVTGDVTQTDLPRGARSGLGEAVALLRDVEGIAQCYFTDRDVVRHPLVQRIVVAYEAQDKRRKAAAGAEHQAPEHQSSERTDASPTDGPTPDVERRRASPRATEQQQVSGQVASTAPEEKEAKQQGLTPQT
ncbi:MAG TPA: PhoH family protein [Polyangiaceae bacterium]|jgi:phosphate starvation-inducible PhoH-like protein|nr:PhoH family protein [Polyangiaceae bacterium]